MINEKSQSEVPSQPTNLLNRNIIRLEQDIYMCRQFPQGIAMYMLGTQGVPSLNSERSGFL